MGTVYRVQHNILQTVMAVKELNVRDAAMRGEAVRQFQREARLLATLQHPNIVRVSDCFEEDGRLYLLMDFVDGESLEDKIARSSTGLPLAQIMPWILTTCDVLEFLHAENPPLVHRDLKPANIMVDRAGKTWVVDFGIASALGSSATTSMLMAFTPGYAPVEQYGVKGTVGPGADIYALGATLYTLLTRTIPPVSVDRMADFTSLVPPTTLNPGIPAALEECILRMMALKSAERYPSVREVRTALAAATSLSSPAGSRAHPAAPGPGPEPLLSPQAFLDLPPAEHALAEEGSFAWPLQVPTEVAPAAGGSFAGPPQAPTEVAPAAGGSFAGSPQAPTEVAPAAGGSFAGPPLAPTERAPAAGGSFAGPPLAPTERAPAAGDSSAGSSLAPTGVASARAPRSTPRARASWALAWSAVLVLVAVGSWAWYVSRGTSNPGSEAFPSRSIPLQQGGDLMVEVQPVGARVKVDGIDRGPAPATVKGLKAGPHEVEAVQEGFSPAKGSASVSEGRTERLSLTLRELPGEVVLDVEPEPVLLTVDGKADGHARRKGERIALAAGSHTVQISRSGYRPCSETITVRRQQQSTLKARLQVLPVKVAVEANVAGVRVLVDGKARGTAPCSVDLSPGAHTVRGERAGWRSDSRQVNVEPGKGTALRLALSVLPVAAPASRPTTPVYHPPPPPVSRPAPPPRRTVQAPRPQVGPRGTREARPPRGRRE